MPSAPSAIITMRAAKAQRSKEAKPKENKYNSKLSIEKSFETAERVKITPRMILRAFFN